MKRVKSLKEKIIKFASAINHFTNPLKYIAKGNTKCFGYFIIHFASKRPAISFPYRNKKKVKKKKIKKYILLFLIRLVTTKKLWGN